MRFGLPWALLLAAATATTAGEGPRLTHGVASGDVTATSAVLWARSSAAAEIVFEIDDDPADSDPRGTAPRRLTATSDAANDFTVQVIAGDLEPATRYHFRVSTGGSEGTETGSFTTAPAAGDNAPVSFIVGGDVGGQGFCRHTEHGYDIFRAMAELEPDFFIANGDMIYADNLCPAVGPGGWPNVPGDFPAVDDPSVDWHNRDQVREVFLAHWRYNRADVHHQDFLRRVPVYAQWDDHEVINDFGAPWASWSKQSARGGFPNLVNAGRGAFFAWNPITRHRQEPERIYRSFRWGRDVELFVLDARSYRGYNDDAQRPHDPKKLLGKPQLDWLLDGLEHSDATWKIVSSDVPLSIPTGSDADLYGRDGFADGNHPWEPTGYAARTGFETELHQLLEALDAGDIRNVVFVVTDVHFATNLRYHLDVDGDGDLLLFHELVSGPLNAGCTPVAPRLDPTFNPVTLYAEAGIFNFSYVRIERRGDAAILAAEVRGEKGEVRFGSRLELAPEGPTVTP